MSLPTYGHVTLELHAQQGTAPEWIRILPAGTFKGTDGRGPFILNDAQSVIKLSLSRDGGVIPVDYNHSLYAAKQTDGAAGWINQLESRDDGIWARVDWTPRARQAIADNEWRFLSPAIQTNAAGDVLSIDSVGLVNKPNFNLPILNAQETEAAQPDLGCLDAADIALMTRIQDDIAAVRGRLSSGSSLQLHAAQTKQASLEAEIMKNLGL
ncbi:phage protease [Acetobacter persici]|uniref:Uncharacterized protein n=1 Tax=Acetobacter persici TaxID=1076596 RepID=A0A6V8I990_9PROT|nr:phage protease [Acetobacter persici]GFE94153.1 hypothetical protein DmAi_22120 [Acetobacter persici]